MLPSKKRIIGRPCEMTQYIVRFELRTVCPTAKKCDDCDEDRNCHSIGDTRPILHYFRLELARSQCFLNRCMPRKDNVDRIGIWTKAKESLKILAINYGAQNSARQTRKPGGTTSPQSGSSLLIWHSARRYFLRAVRKTLVCVRAASHPLSVAPSPVPYLSWGHSASANRASSRRKLSKRHRSGSHGRFRRSFLILPLHESSETIRDITDQSCV